MSDDSLFGPSSSSDGEYGDDFVAPSVSSGDQGDENRIEGSPSSDGDLFGSSSSSDEEAAADGKDSNGDAHLSIGTLTQAGAFCDTQGEHDSDEDFIYVSDSSEDLQALLDTLDAPRSSVQNQRASKETQKRGLHTTRRNKRMHSGVNSSCEAECSDQDSIAATMSLNSSDESSKSPAQQDDEDHDLKADRTPRIRRTNTYTERVAMANAREDVQNKIPPLSQLVFSSWSELNDVLESYCNKYKLLFRARDTRTVKKHNSMKTLKIPIKMEYSYKVFRCTHGCHQKSRAKGQRSTPLRFTGCKARFTAEVKNVATEGSNEEWKIVLRNWTWTHNHPTNDVIFSGYLGAGSIPGDSRVLEEVCLLADANAESHYIRDYLSSALERQVTSQQARNIVQRVLKNSSAEKKLTDMLNALHENDDHDVLVIHDQNDVTCGIVMQTAVQKLAFQQWGETLCMDWTYNTNNLGFHLGSLLVTSSTGRGLPVLDFIALDERIETMEIILAFFKSHYRLWTAIETVVIDKDFKEWRVLLRCFPQVAVLLCQFHTMANWKKVVKRAKYNLNGVQQDEVENSIKQMMYSTTVDAFNRARDGLEKFCKGECPDVCSRPCPEIFEYFQANWESCSEMWSNHGRGKYFTAGNTTTNRIESNWNQLKRLLGRKTRIDRTIAGLLQNQVNVINNMMTSLRKFSTQSRPVDTIPPFLQKVSAQLSNDTFAKVSTQWDLFMVNQKEVECVQRSSKQSEWSVLLPGSTWVVDAEEWSCSCMFHTSRRLPCQHIMMVASKAHGLDALPAAAVPIRWSMKETGTLYDTLESSLAPLRRVIDMTKARPSVTQSSPAATKLDQRPGRRKVKYVRLKRREQANMVVLSDAEKYARAQSLFEPLIEKLSGLSTVDYYQQMNKWKTVIERGIDDTVADTNATVVEGESDSDSYFDQLDYADVMAEMEADQELAMEKTSLAVMARARAQPSDASDVDTPGSDGSDVAPTLPTTSASVLTSVGSDERVLLTGKESSNASDKKRGVEVMRLPAPQAKTRKKLKQGWITPQPKYAAVLISSEVTTTMPSVIQWAYYHPNVEKVSNVLEQYPVIMTDKFIQARPVVCQVATESEAGEGSKQHAFVIPGYLLKKAEASMAQMHAKLNAERNSDDSDEENKPKAPWGLMVSMGTDVIALHSSFLYSMRSFYCLKAQSSKYLLDIAWLKKQEWRFVQAHPVEPFSLETKTNGLPHSEVSKIHQALAADILQKYSTLSLMTELKTKSGSCVVRFCDIVDGVLRGGMLNDNIVDMGIKMIGESMKGCVTFSSLVSNMGWPSYPSRWLSETSFVIVPLHLSTDHWGVIIVEIAFPTTLKVHFYEPLHQQCYRKELKNFWKHELLPYLQQWHSDSGAKERFPKEIIQKWIDEPAQPDFKSCGVMILGLVYAYVRNAHRFERHRITEAYLSVMRLRLAWLLLCFTKRLQPNEYSLTEMQATDTEINKVLTRNE